MRSRELGMAGLADLGSTGSLTNDFCRDLGRSGVPVLESFRRIWCLGFPFVFTLLKCKGNSIACK